MSTGALIAMIWLPCASALHQSPLINETVAFTCPNTVTFIYEPVPVVAKKPIVAKKKAAPRKKYRKRRRHK